MSYNPQPGDLVRYLSRTLLVISTPYLGMHGPQQWVDTIEIDENTHRKVRCDKLTLIQKTGSKND